MSKFEHLSNIEFDQNDIDEKHIILLDCFPFLVKSLE
jgi:hypothetical protein